MLRWKRTLRPAVRPAVHHCAAISSLGTSPVAGAPSPADIRKAGGGANVHRTVHFAVCLSPYARVDQNLRKVDQSLRKFAKCDQTLAIGCKMLANVLPRFDKFGKVVCQTARRRSIYPQPSHPRVAYQKHQQEIIPKKILRESQPAVVFSLKNENPVTVVLGIGFQRRGCVRPSLNGRHLVFVPHA